MNPYFINEPASISFSGGRTSGYMLHKILEAHDGKLPDYVKITFANTGKEMPQTLDFIRDCGEKWGVDIVWLEFGEVSLKSENPKRFNYSYDIVNYETASRKGEPFDRLIKLTGCLPTPVQRFCTGQLKVKTFRRYLEDQGFETPFLQYVGIRGDEQRRAMKIHNTIADGGERYCPLWVDGVTAKDVGDFWRENDFDLHLPNNNGVTDWGNCDLCHLKALGKKRSIIRERPDLAEWWIEKEKETNLVFRRDHPTYETLLKGLDKQTSMFDENEFDESISCFCGD